MRLTFLYNIITTIITTLIMVMVTDKCHHQFVIIIMQLISKYYNMLSYHRDTALQGAL